MKTLAGRNGSFRIGGMWASLAAALRRNSKPIVGAMAAVVVAGSLHAQSLWIYGLQDNDVFFGELSVSAQPEYFSAAKVDFYVDGKLAASATAIDGYHSVTLTGLTEGMHQVQAKAVNGNITLQSESRLFEVINPTPSKLSIHRFNSNHTTWSYADDLFRGTAHSRYAQAEYPGQIVLGGVDDVDVTGISGGYVTTINLPAAADVHVRLGFEMWTTEDVDRDESLEMLVAVDGKLRGLNKHDYVERITDRDGDHRRVAVPLGRLAAGPHRIAVGGYLNKKTERTEEGLIDLDWIVVEALPGPNAFPTLGISSPAEGAHYPAGAIQSIDVQAADSDGTIVKVELYRHNRLLSAQSTRLEPPFQFPFFPYEGVDRVTLAAYDNHGAVTTLTRTFYIGNGIPSAGYKTPVAGQYVKLGGRVPIAVDAWDEDGSITRVEFYIDDELKGIDSTPPYTVNASVAGLPEGAHGIRVVPVDDLGVGNRAIETYIQITGNFPPTARITSPARGAAFRKDTTVPVKIAAADEDGRVVRVELWVDGGAIRLTDTSAPFAFDLAGLAPGSHLVEAYAFDDNGRMSDWVEGTDFQVGVWAYATCGSISPSSGDVTYYNPNDAVTVTANSPAAGKLFDRWMGDSDLLGNPFAASTTLKIPSNRGNVFVDATYKDAANPTVVKLVLINANNDQPIAGFDPLYDGAVLSFSKLRTQSLNLRAVTTPELTGSVHFAWDAGGAGALSKVENTAPYALAGDTNGNYHAWKPALGKHTLTVWACSGPNQQGTRSLPLTINVKVVE